MVSLVPHLTTNCRVRQVRVSVPLIEPLLDGAKCFPPETLPAPAGEEFRPMFRPRIAQTNPPRPPRALTLRSLVKLALACESAEDMGKKLKRRFDRSYTRRGLVPSDRRRAEAEAELDRLLGQP